MTLPMSRPFKHPNSGVYWLRKRVPDDLRSVVGKREEKLSLRTRDPEEAKRLHAQALIDLEARWTNLRRGARALSKGEVENAAALLFDFYLAHFDVPLSDEHRAALNLIDADKMWGSGQALELLASVPALELGSVDMPEIGGHRAREVSELLADDYLQRAGFLADAGSRAALVTNLGLALKYAALWPVGSSQRPAWAGYPRSGRRNFPNSNEPKRVARNQAGFYEVFDGWVAEKQPRDRTRYAWRRVLDQLGEFLEHTDAARVSADDLIRWKSALLAEGLRAKTIRDGKLAPVKAMFQWAVDNRRIAQNPAERITIDLKSKLSDKKRGYSDEEARKVLTAARAEKDPLRHWVPWLCAYTGARVAEVCQLRREDIVQIDDIWCVRFVPEAGSLKNANSERAVPLHQALLNEGILKFVNGVKAGPLFSEIKPDRFDSRGGNGTKVLGRWVRSIGLTDARLSPSHSWRHRLRTLGRRYGLAPDILDAITGHQRKTVADTYGEFPMEALNRELQKIPPLL